MTVCSCPHSYPLYVGVFSLSNQTNHFQVYGILFQGIFGFFSISSLFSTRATLNFHINPYILQPSAMLKEPSDLVMKQTRNCHAFSSHSPVIYFCEVNNWENEGISSRKSENLSNLLSQIISCVLIFFTITRAYNKSSYFTGVLTYQVLSFPEVRKVFFLCFCHCLPLPFHCPVFISAKN